MKGAMVRAVVVSLWFCSTAPSLAGDKVLLAVFAHPDDESTVAPILARYAREGVDVTVAIATDGRYGANEFAGFEPGERLVAARRDEMRCAAAQLGVRLVHWDYHDQLRAAEGYDGHIPHVRALLKDVADLIESLRPDAIITWGPDGGSNHMDHRLIGDTVTGVYLSRDWGKEIGLYYYGTPVSQIDDEDAQTRFGVLDRYLTTAVRYTPEDFDAAAAALRCHTSQFTQADMNSMIERRKERGPTIYLRKFAAPREHNNTVFQD